MWRGTLSSCPSVKHGTAEERTRYGMPTRADNLSSWPLNPKSPLLAPRSFLDAALLSQLTTDTTLI